MSSTQRSRYEGAGKYLARRHSTNCNYLTGKRCDCATDAYVLDIPAARTGTVRHKETIKAPSLTVAEAIRDDKLANLAHGTAVAGSGPTVAELAEDLIEKAHPDVAIVRRRGNLPYKHSAWRGIRDELRGVWVPALGNKRIAAVRSPDVDRVVERLARDGLSQSTVNNRLNAFRVLCRYAMSPKVHAITVNPCDGVNAVGAAEAPRAYIESIEHLMMYVNAVQRDSDRAVWATAGLTGLRNGELRGLLKTDVDLKRMRIMVRRNYDPSLKDFVAPKNRKARAVPILDPLLPYIEPLLGGTGLLFPGDYGGGEQPVSDRALAVRAREAWEEAKLPKLYLRSADDYYNIVGETWPTLHVCRHTFATHMIGAGVDLAIVADWMGHDVTVLRNRYRHRLEEYDAAMVAKANAYMAQVNMPV